MIIFLAWLEERRKKKLLFQLSYLSASFELIFQNENHCIFFHSTNFHHHRSIQISNGFPFVRMKRKSEIEHGEKVRSI